MALQYKQAHNVQVGETTESRDYNRLALAFNSRLEGGVGDPTWRILWYAHSLFRNLRTRLSDTEFPDEDEWWKYWAHLISADHPWPEKPPGEEGGLNVVNGLVSWLWGRITDPDDTGLPSEPDRMNGPAITGNGPLNVIASAGDLVKDGIPISIEEIPIASVGGVQLIYPLYFYPYYINPDTDIVNQDSLSTGAGPYNGIAYKVLFGNDPLVAGDGFHRPNTPAEQWILAKAQRGNFDPTPGASILSSPAISAPRIFYEFRQPIRSPYLKSYATYEPIPPIKGYCYESPDFPSVPYFDIKFTNLNDGTTQTFAGGCAGTPNRVVGKIETPDAYIVFTDNAGTITSHVLLFSEWIEGPYTAGANITKRHGEQIDQTLNYFSLNFRGTYANRIDAVDGPGCYDVQRDAFNFEKFLNSQYLLAPAVGIAYEVEDPDNPSETILAVSEDYPFWYFYNNTASPVVKSANTVLTLLEVIDMDDSDPSDPQKVIAETPHPDGERVMPSNVQLSGYYVYAEGLTQPITLTFEATNGSFQKTYTPDGNGKINQIEYFNKGTPVAPLGTYKIKLTNSYTFPANSYIEFEVLEQLIMKPELPDMYTVLRMSSCDDNVIGEGEDWTGDMFADSPAAFSFYYNYGYIHGFKGFEMDSYDIEPFMNPRAIYKAARELFTNYVRMADRKQLIAYEVINEGGVPKSVLYFNRYAFPENSVVDIPAPVLGALTEMLPQGEIEAEVVEETTLENGVKYVLVKSGTQLANTQITRFTGDAFPIKTTDLAAYGNNQHVGDPTTYPTMYAPFTPGTPNGSVGQTPNENEFNAKFGVIIGNNHTVTEQYLDAVDSGTLPAEGDPVNFLFATSYPKMTETGDNGFLWTVERRIRRPNTTVLQDWTIIASDGSSYDKGQLTGYLWSDFTYEDVGRANIGFIDYRVTGKSNLFLANGDLKVYKAIQTNKLTAGKTYIVRALVDTVYTGTGVPMPVTAESGVYYPPGGTFRPHGSQFIANSGTSYELATGNERLYELVLTGIQNGHTYLVKGPGYVKYPAGSGTNYTNGQTFTGSSSTDYNISDNKTFLFDLSSNPLTYKTDFDVFRGIAPSRDAAPLTGITAGIKYKVKSTDGGSVEYNGNHYANGSQFTGVANQPNYSPAPSNSDARAFALTGGVWATAPKKKYSNEWLMSMTSGHYHPSDTSNWHNSTYNDELLFLANRCHVYSRHLILKQHDNLNMQFTYGSKPVIRSEAPSGYTYLEDTHNASAANFVPCEEKDSEQSCLNKQKEGRKNFYRSCQIYKPDYKIESVELTDIEGEVKVKLNRRLDHCSSAPVTIAKEAIYHTYTQGGAASLKAEPYRSDENAVREYIRCAATNCMTLGAGGVQCTRYKIGDYPPFSDLPYIPDNPFGACLPRFYFVKKVPYVYAETGETNPAHVEVPEPEIDTRRDVDPFVQMELYLRAMCGGFADRYTTKKIDCKETNGTSRIVDYTMENLVYQASRRSESTNLNPTATVEVVESQDQQVSVVSKYTISWTHGGVATSYNVQQRKRNPDGSYTTWTSVATVTTAPWSYLDTVTDAFAENPAILPRVEYQVIGNNGVGSVSATVTVDHEISWWYDSYHGNRLYKRTKSIGSGTYSSWIELTEATYNYRYPTAHYEVMWDTDDAELQFKVTRIKAIDVTWNSVNGRSYVLQRKITRDHDSDPDYVDIADVDATASTTTKRDTIFFGPEFHHDVTDTVEVLELPVDGASANVNITPIQATYNGGPIDVFQDPDNYRHTLTWDDPDGHSWTVMRRYTYHGSQTSWTVLTTSGSGSYTDLTSLSPFFGYGDVEYEVSRVPSAQTPPTLTWAASANKCYHIKRTITDKNGRVNVERLPISGGETQKLCFSSPETGTFTDDGGFTTMAVAVTYQVFEDAGALIKWNEFPSNNPDLLYKVVRVVNGNQTVIEDYTKSQNTYQHQDATTFDTESVRYYVYVTFSDRIKNVQYRIVALGNGTQRWLSPMPVSKRPDRLKGFGPLPNTCMHAVIFNNFANAINLLTEARVAIPTTVECTHWNRSLSYTVGGTTYALNGDTQGTLGCSPQSGETTDNQYQVGDETTPNNFNVIFPTLPLQEGGTWSVPTVTDCSSMGFSATKSYGPDTGVYTCSGGVKWKARFTENKVQLTIKPNEYSLEALPKDLRAIYKPGNIGFYARVIKSCTTHTIENAAVPPDHQGQSGQVNTDAASCSVDPGDGRINNFLKEGADFKAVIPDETCASDTCEFISSQMIEAPPLPEGAGAIVGPVELSTSFPETGPCGYGGGSSSIAISVPNVDQLVSVVVVPTTYS